MIPLPLRTAQDPSALAHELSKELVRLSHQNSPRPIQIALSGGSTPKLWFQILADHYAEQVQWENVEFWWGDERCVPLASSESNAGEALRLLFHKVPAKTHPLPQLVPEAAASAYERLLEQRLPANPAGIPVFDWILLGIGEDGHTASLFPGESYPWRSTCLATHPVSGQVRVSLGMPTLLAAKKLSFLCTGSSKKPILAAIQSRASHAEIWPAYQVAKAHAQCDMWADQAALAEF